MVVDDEGNVGAGGDRKNFSGHGADFGDGGLLGTKLDEVRAASAEVFGHEFRRTAAEVGGIYEGIEATSGERFHLVPSSAKEAIPNELGMQRQSAEMILK